MLNLQDITLSVTDQSNPAGTPNRILKGLSLHIPKGEVHAIMGPNGAGKSTLSYLLTGKEGYDVHSGKAEFLGEDILELSPEERAAKGLFLSFQYPVEIQGVPVLTFIRAALNAQRKARGEEEISAPDFMKKARAVAAQLEIKAEFLRRPVNVGFSGGEKKRLEMFQMAMLEPKFIILDETDSGLDIDALKTVSASVNALRSPERSMLIITHYQRLLDYIKPDKVHILADGQIVKSGEASLALQLENDGYDGVIGDERRAG